MHWYVSICIYFLYVCTFRPPNYHGAMYGSEAHYSHPNNVTLPLFEPEVLMFDVINICASAKEVSVFSVTYWWMVYVLPTSLLQESVCLNRPYDLNQTVDSPNLDDQEVDLELKLWSKICWHALYLSQAIRLIILFVPQELECLQSCV